LRVLAAEAFDLTGKTVWVTGSSRGIGAGIARHFAAHGASIAVHGRRAERAEAIARELAGAGASAIAVTADLTDAEAAEEAATTIVDHFGGLDVLIANVGGAMPMRLADMKPDQWQKMLDMNLTAAFTATKAAYPHLAAAGGSAVLISANAAAHPTPGFGAYGAAKAAVEHLTRTLAAEWGPEVRVNGVSPGLVRTEGSMRALFRDDPELLARAGTAMALGRVGEPEDIAWACHYLVSEAAGYVTGAVLAVDGGRTEGPAEWVARSMQ
jgi:3-oxoacyl-[acyl-carrier protein] reductase